MKKQTQHISKEDAEEFTQGLGQIASGGYRQILLAIKLGVPTALGYAAEKDWVNERIGGYVRYTTEDRRRIVDELLANGASNRQISKALGVHEDTVSNDKKATGTHPLRNTRPKSIPKIQDTGQSKPKNPVRHIQDNHELSSAEVQSKLQRAADEGFELVVWNKIKDTFLPVWFELLEMLEPDEQEILPWAILNHASLIKHNQNETA